MSQELEKLRGEFLSLENRMEELERKADGHFREFTETQKLLIMSVNTNTDLTRQVAADTADLRDIWKDTKAAFRMFNILMQFFWGSVKYVVIPVAGVAAVGYMITHEGRLPEWFKSLLVMFA